MTTGADVERKSQQRRRGERKTCGGRKNKKKEKEKERKMKKVEKENQS